MERGYTRDQAFQVFQQATKQQQQQLQLQQQQQQQQQQQHLMLTQPTYEYSIEQYNSLDFDNGSRIQSQVPSSLLRSTISDDNEYLMVQRFQAPPQRTGFVGSDAGSVFEREDYAEILNVEVAKLMSKGYTFEQAEKLIQQKQTSPKNGLRQVDSE